MDKETMNKLLGQAETLELDDVARRGLEGSFISLKCGNTHYRLEGEGEPIVLVPGYATPYYIYDRIFDRLVSLGFKVLTYDLLGRGLSERVTGIYDDALFSRQLDELTQTLLGDTPFILIGTSMGGIITTKYTSEHPGKVKRLFLFAPAGMDNFKPPFYMKLCRIPLLGKAIFKAIGAKALLNGCASEMYNSPDEVDPYMEKFALCLRYKGFVECTFSSLINTILMTERSTENYKKCADNNIPMVVVWGTIDKTMPYYQMSRMKEVCPDAEYHTFENSGHVFVYDEPDRTMEVLGKKLKEI